MSKKIQLPKPVCDALQEMVRMYDAPEIIHEYYNDRIQDSYYVNAIRKVSASDIMHALVLGFEEAKTPEEQIHDLYHYKIDRIRHVNSFDAYRLGIEEALKTHGFEYEWFRGLTP